MYLDEAVIAISRFDDPVAWMYLDRQGFVCIGAHQRILQPEVAASLPFQRWTAATATREEIKNEFERVKQMRVGYLPSAYRRSDSLLLPKTAICKILRESLVACAVTLSASFPDFDSFPDSVKVALLDICYDTGLSQMSEEMIDAVRKQNWAAAAWACRRENVTRERNLWAKQQFQEVPVTV